MMNRKRLVIGLIFFAMLTIIAEADQWCLIGKQMWGQDNPNCREYRLAAIDPVSGMDSQKYVTVDDQGNCVMTRRGSNAGYLLDIRFSRAFDDSTEAANALNLVSPYGGDIYGCFDSRGGRSPGSEPDGSDRGRGGILADYDIVLCKDVDRDNSLQARPVDITNTFSTEDDGVFAFIDFGTFIESHEVECIWYPPNNEQPIEKQETTKAGSDYAFFYLEILETDAGGEGNVKIYVDGKFIKALPFTIEEEGEINRNANPQDWVVWYTKGGWQTMDVTTYSEYERETSEKSILMGPFSSKEEAMDTICSQLTDYSEGYCGPGGTICGHPFAKYQGERYAIERLDCKNPIPKKEAS